MRARVFGLCVALAVIASLPGAAQQQPARQPDVVFVPTPSAVVDAMLKLAMITSSDLVYKVSFVTDDVLTADVSPATVVTLYLSPSFNSRLAPKLMKELKPGTRIVSHAFDLGSWKPQQRVLVSDRPIFLWTVGAPARRR